MLFRSVGWQVYHLTHDPLSLGLIGLAEAIPFFCVALFAGHMADIVNRKKIILVTNFIYFLCAVSLMVLTTYLSNMLTLFGAMPIYIIILITGLARGFMWPAQSAFAAQLVPKELYGNAATWNSVAWQTAEVSGPAIGGLICGFYGMGQAYLLLCVFRLLGYRCFFSLKKERCLKSY